MDDEGDAAKNEDEVDYFKQAASLLEEDAGQEGHKHLFAGMSSIHHRCDKIGKKMEKANLGKSPATKSDESLEKFQTAFDPPPHFWKIILQFFYNGYGRIYSRRHRPDSISYNQLKSILLKKHTLNPENTLLYINFMLKKPCLKFPKSAI